jgi:hypothetical protein
MYMKTDITYGTRSVVYRELLKAVPKGNRKAKFASCFDIGLLPCELFLDAVNA